MGRKGQISFDLIFAILLLLVIFGFLTGASNNLRDNVADARGMVFLKTMATDIAAQMEYVYNSYLKCGEVLVKIDLDTDIFQRPPPTALSAQNSEWAIQYGNYIVEIDSVTPYKGSRVCVKQLDETGAQVGQELCQNTTVVCWTGNTGSTPPSTITLDPSAGDKLYIKASNDNDNIFTCDVNNPP